MKKLQVVIEWPYTKTNTKKGGSGMSIITQLCLITEALKIWYRIVLKIYAKNV